MTEPNDPSRRRFLTTSSAAAVVCAAGAGSALPACGNRPMTMGDAATNVTVGSFPVGMFLANEDAEYILARDAMGFYAYSNLCTHEGCPIPAPASATGFSQCPCHMSRFDATGTLLNNSDGVMAMNGAVGAQGSLVHYGITFTGTGSTATVNVNKATRLPDRTMRFPPPA